MTTLFDPYSRMHAELNDLLATLTVSRKRAAEDRPYDWYSRQDLRNIREKHAAVSLYHDLLCKGA